MSGYGRLYVPGGPYFFTVALADRSATTLVDEIELLRTVYASVTQEHPIKCDAMVILPDHMHAVWTLPTNDVDFSIRWKKIKGRFSQHCRAEGRPSRSKAAKGEKGIWQRRFWEHAIRDASDLQAHINYCWWNPVNIGWSINQKIGPIHPPYACWTLPRETAIPRVEAMHLRRKGLLSRSYHQLNRYLRRCIQRPAQGALSL